VRAAYSILPKSIRKEVDGLDSFIDACISALDASSAVRDLDVMIAKFRELQVSLEKGSKTDLVRLRSNKAITMEKRILALSSLRRPEINLEITDKELDKRFRRRVKDLKKKSRELLSISLSDESKAEELHALRKVYKKLRYTLELEPSAPKKSRKEIKTLKKRQDLLGAIHDSDVSLSFLEKNGRLFDSASVISSERRARHGNFQTLVELCSKVEI
jgi:CHAD domain-containing protein